MNEQKPWHQCGKVVENNGIITYPKSIEETGECNQGCCTYFHCKICGERFTVEWPD